MQRTIYLDNATTTVLDPKVLEAMKQYFFEWYGSPTHEYGHTFGLKAREALERSREILPEASEPSPKK